MAASIDPECNNIKECATPVPTQEAKANPLYSRKYDTCFLKWYSEKYLRGNPTSNECEELFAKYKTCLYKTLKERGIDSMLDEARKNTPETDAEYNRRT
ncbi:hypothetical protein BJX76DRAFT_362785 [Aspergillus varians]